MIKHYSQNIQNVIQRELFAANQSVKIAVAWFTNDLLFQPLLLKLVAGVKIDLILNKDEINLSSSIDFNQFVNSGGNLYWNDTNRLMHEKFCIIDDRVVITGSYNWTHKAESNYESISVFTNENETLREYKSRFETLSKGFTKQIIQITPQPVINRCKCPVSLQPYTKLKFYHSVNLFQSSNTPILAQEYEDGPYALLDRNTFLPKTAFIFSDYSSFVPGRNFLWLRGETKWGLFDCNKLEFVIKPQFDKIDNGYTRGMIVSHQGLCGVVSNTTKMLIPCVYEEIIATEDCFIVKQNGNWGIFKEFGEEFLPCKYEQITNNKEFFTIYHNGRLGLLFKDSNGFVEPQYDHVGEYLSEKELIIVKRGLGYGVLDTWGKEVIPCEYDEIVECDDFIRLKKNGKFGLFRFGTIVEECVFDTMLTIAGVKNLFLLYVDGRCAIFDGYKKISDQLYDNVEYDKDSEGNEMLFLEQHKLDGIFYGVYIIARRGLRIDDDRLRYIPRGDRMIDEGYNAVERYNDLVAEQRLFDCQYSSITHDEMIGRAFLLLKKEYQHNSTLLPQYTLYCFNNGYILGGQSSWCSNFSSRSEFGIDLILSHNGDKCRVYLMNEAKELRGCYDEVCIYNGVIGLIKNGKFGAYLLGEQKYVSCEYDRIEHGHNGDFLLFLNDAQGENKIVNLKKVYD